MQEYTGYTAVGAFAFDRINGTGADAVYPPNDTDSEAQTLPFNCKEINIRADGGTLLVKGADSDTLYRTLTDGDSVSLPLFENGATQLYFNSAIGVYAEIILFFDRPM